MDIERMQKEIKELEKENKYLKEKFGDEVADVILTNKKQISSLQQQLNQEAKTSFEKVIEETIYESTPISASDLPDPSEFNEGGMVDDLREILDFRIQDLSPNEYANFADSYRIDPEDAMEMSNFIYSLNADEVKEITKVLDSKNYATGGEIQVDRWLKLLGPEKYRKYVDDAFSKMKFQKLSNDKNIYKINTITDKSRTGEFGDLMDFYFTERLEKEGIGYAKGGMVEAKKEFKYELEQLNTAQKKLYKEELKRVHDQVAPHLTDRDIAEYINGWYGENIDDKEVVTPYDISGKQAFDFGFKVIALGGVKKDPEFWEGENTYAKGGKIFSRDEINENDLDTIFVEGRYHNGDKFSENQDTTDIDYVIEKWKDYVDGKNSMSGIATYKIYLRFNNGDEKELVEGYAYAKGGIVEVFSKETNQKLYEIEGGNESPYYIYRYEADEGDDKAQELIDDLERDTFLSGSQYEEYGEDMLSESEGDSLLYELKNDTNWSDRVYVKENFAKGSKVKFDDSPMMKKLWNERGYDIPYLESLSNAELKGIYETEFDDERTYNFETDADEIPNEYAKGGITDIIEAYEDPEGRGYSVVIDGAVFEMNEGTLPNNSVDMYIGERSEYPSDVSHWGKKISYTQLPIVIKDKITARSGVAVEKKNLGGFLFGATVGGYVGYKYGLTKEKKQVRDLFKTEQKYAKKAREKWGKKKSEPQYEDVIDVDFEEYKYAKGGKIGIEVNEAELDFLTNEVRITYNDLSDNDDKDFISMINTLLEKITNPTTTLYLTDSEKDYLYKQISMIIGEGEYGEDYYLDLKELEDLQDKLDSYAKGGEVSETNLKKMFKDDDISWGSDKEFFEIAKNRGFNYDDEKETFVSIKTYNEGSYSDKKYAKGGRIKKGDLVKINKNYLDSPEEKDMVYEVLSNPNANNRVDIRDVNSTLSIPPIESVKVEHVEKWFAKGGKIDEFERREEIFNRLIQDEGPDLQDMGLTDDEIQDKITEMVDAELKQEGYAKGGEVDDLEYALERTEYINEDGKALDSDFNELRNEEGEVIYIDRENWDKFKMVDKDFDVIEDFPSPLMEKLAEEHQKEADKQKSEIHNFGWGQGDDFLHSKTEKGTLYSEIDDDGNVTHEWDYDYWDKRGYDKGGKTRRTRVLEYPYTSHLIIRDAVKDLKEGKDYKYDARKKGYALIEVGAEHMDKIYSHLNTYGGEAKMIDERLYSKGGEISEKDKFWDENAEDLIKIVGDNPEYFRDYLLSIGLTQDDVDAEMDGTSKHIAITILNMSDIETLNEFLDMDKYEDIKQDKPNYLTDEDLAKEGIKHDEYWTHKKSKKRWKLTFARVVNKKDKGLQLEDTDENKEPHQRESIESLLKNYTKSNDQRRKRLTMDDVWVAPYDKKENPNWEKDLKLRIKKWNKQRGYAKGGKTPQAKRWSDLHTLIWDGAKCDDAECTLLISKKYTLEEVGEQVERFNDNNNEWWISDEIEETDDGKHWVLESFNDEYGYAKGGKLTKRQKDLKELIWLKWNDESDFKIPKTYTQEEVEEQVERYNNAHIDTDISDDWIEEWNQEEKYWLLNKIKYDEDEEDYAKGGEIKVGDTLYHTDSPVGKKRGTVVKVMPDMVNVDFGQGDVYGITKGRIKGNKIYAEGGTIDYFEHYDKLPKKMRNILNKYFKKYEEGEIDYKDTKKLLKDVEKEGYTFEYGLDNEPYDLKKFSDMHPLSKHINKKNK